MAAADVAAVGDIAGDEPQGRLVVADHPFDAELSHHSFQPTNRRLELALLDGDREQLVRERRAPSIADQGVEEAQAVLTARQADGDSSTGAEHREAAHGPPDGVEHTALEVLVHRNLRSALEGPATHAPD